MKNRIWITVVLVVIAVGFAFLVRWRLVHSYNDPLVFTYCHKMLRGAAEQWKMENKTNAYPNVAGKGGLSLALITAYLVPPTSDGILRDYGYVPGLKEDDPKDLVLMYLKKKTRRTWHGDSSPPLFAKLKWINIGPTWESDLPEGARLENTRVFKARLQNTLEFLKENNRANWENVVKEHTEFLDSIK